MTWTSVLSPAEYTAAYVEGVYAYKEVGLRAVNPHLRFEYDNAADHTRALAWENGWWSKRLNA